jgi:antitoxin ChpS
MLLATLRTVGESVMLAVPKQILKGLGLSANTQVGLTVSEGRLIVEPRPRPRYTLTELLAQCDVTAQVSEESRTWLDAGPIGREII